MVGTGDVGLKMKVFLQLMTRPDLSSSRICSRISSKRLVSLLRKLISPAELRSSREAVMSSRSVPP